MQSFDSLSIIGSVNSTQTTTWVLLDMNYITSGRRRRAVLLNDMQVGSLKNKVG